MKKKYFDYFIRYGVKGLDTWFCSRKEALKHSRLIHPTFASRYVRVVCELIDKDENILAIGCASTISQAKCNAEAILNANLNSSKVIILS